MSMLSSVKDAVLARAVQLMGSPKVSKVMSDPRLMSAAMRAVNAGSAVKSEVDKAARLAAGALGWATQEEVTELRATIQSQQESIAILETRALAAEARAAEAEALAAPAAKDAPAKGGGNGKKSARR